MLRRACLPPRDRARTDVVGLSYDASMTGDREVGLACDTRKSDSATCADLILAV